MLNFRLVFDNPFPSSTGAPQSTFGTERLPRAQFFDALDDRGFGDARQGAYFPNASTPAQQRFTSDKPTCLCFIECIKHFE